MVLIVYVLHKPLAGIIERLRSFAYKGAELTFAQAIEHAEAKADRAALPPPQPLPALDRLAEPAIAGAAPPIDEERLYALADLHPIEAVLAAWEEVERAVVVAAKRISLSIEASAMTYKAALDELVDRGMLDGTTLDFLSELRRLRNQAAHASPYVEMGVTYGSAMEYIRLARRVMRVLDSIKPSPPNVVLPQP